MLTRRPLIQSAFLTGLVALVMTACKSSDPGPMPLPATTPSPAPSDPMPVSANQSVHVKIKTSEGSIVLELYPDKAPLSVANFLKYVDDQYYDGTIFHRVINGFMVQGGGMIMQDGQLLPKQGVRPPIKNEASNGLKNIKGSVAMARRPDPHSATSQFFINVADNSQLDYPSFDGFGYTVFGRVIKGQDVVDKIRLAKTGQVGRMRDVPKETITIKSIRRE
jgi:cyclophilin family peptidyl-prolyl cis-trans isomerase